MERIEPNSVDGDPHDVAAFAGTQTESFIEEATEALRGFYWAARGAWLTAEEYRTGEMPQAAEFDDTPQGRKINSLHEQLKVLLGEQRKLTKAAGWNPRSL